MRHGIRHGEEMQPPPPKTPPPHAQPPPPPGNPPEWMPKAPPAVHEGIPFRTYAAPPLEPLRFKAPPSERAGPLHAALHDEPHPLHAAPLDGPHLPSEQLGSCTRDHRRLCLAHHLAHVMVLEPTLLRMPLEAGRETGDPTSQSRRCCWWLRRNIIWLLS